ncbi:hypothetical protein VNO77_00120 [Canavalia gladiata]|uniref:Uncharacterized protein n=1 Tax=Canavalia gladiata TaxID=3824 RepID=A0AAN9MNV0_CANGL
MRSRIPATPPHPHKKFERHQSDRNYKDPIHLPVFTQSKHSFIIHKHARGAVTGKKNQNRRNNEGVFTVHNESRSESIMMVCRDSGGVRVQELLDENDESAVKHNAAICEFCKLRVLKLTLCGVAMLHR